MLARYLPVAATQIPLRSDVPSGVRGAGAERFGLPSLVRGIPGVGTCTHWAAAGMVIATANRRIRFIEDSPAAAYFTTRLPHKPLDRPRPRSSRGVSEDSPHWR